MRGTPERGGAFVVDARLSQHVEGVLHEPEPRRQANVGVRPGVQQRLHDLEVGCILLLVFDGVCIRGTRCPLPFQHGKQRCRIGRAGEVGIRPFVDEHHCQVELAVDGCHEQGRGPIPRRLLIDVGTTFEQEFDGFTVPLANGMVEGGQSAPAVNQLSVGFWLRFAVVVVFRIVIYGFAVGIVGDGIGALVRSFVVFVRALDEIIARRVGHVRPFPLDLAGCLDGCLHLAGLGCPVGSAALFCLEIGKKLRDTLFSGLVGLLHFLRVHGVRCKRRIGTGIQ